MERSLDRMLDRMHDRERPLGAATPRTSPLADRPIRDRGGAPIVWRPAQRVVTPDAVEAYYGGAPLQHTPCFY